MTTVGVVGLGLLGHAVASRLIAGGHRVVGHDVVPEREAALVSLGGTTASSAAAVAAGAEAVFVVLPSLAAVESAVLGAAGVVEGARSGQAVIQMSTISPTLTERLAREAAARGCAFLDCPVTGTSGQVARGDGALLVGGDPALYARWRPVLESIVPRSFHVGTAGQAMLLKLVANLLIAVNSAAAAEAVNLARRGGLDAARALEVLVASAATSRMLEVRGPLMVRDEFPAQMKLDLFMKDLHLIQDAASTAGAPVPLTDTAEKLYAAAQTAGHGADDLAVIVPMLRR